VPTNASYPPLATDLAGVTELIPTVSVRCKPAVTAGYRMTAVSRHADTVDCTTAPNAPTRDVISVAFYLYSYRFLSRLTHKILTDNAILQLKWLLRHCSSLAAGDSPESAGEAV
jgi:hypothetical protein